MLVASLGLALGLGAEAGQPTKRVETRHGSNATKAHYQPVNKNTRTNLVRHTDKGNVARGKRGDVVKQGKDRRTSVRRKIDRFSPELIKKHNGVEKRLGKRVTDRDYHKKFARKFRFKVNGAYKYGWKYPGRYHRHWKFYSYNRYYRKWLFYDDCTATYYYFCKRCTCYLPIAYVCGRCMEEPDDAAVDPCTESGGTVETADEGEVEEADCCNR
jgi:hypothetical protein